jgi:UDP-N-acetylmuramate dehydrogenase
MEEGQKMALNRLVGGSLFFDRPLARYTTIGIGGPAECLYEPAGPEQLTSVLAFLNRESIPYLVIGRGSNLLVTDAGVRGVVVVIGRGMSGFNLDQRPGGMVVTAGAGLSIAEMISRCSDEGLSGLEFLAWIPGSVGGAVAMNAGAFGFETGQMVREVHALSPDGKLDIHDRADLSFGYRHCGIVPGAVIIKAVFDVERADPSDIAGAVAGYGRLRRESQPFGVRSAGSVFKNPPGRYAGKLIDAAGLKGERIGGAVISETHGNFIVNSGGAGSEDVLRLVGLVRRKVFEMSGVELDLEIRVVGER